MRVKAIPYAKTVDSFVRGEKTMGSADSDSRPGSCSGESTTSIRTSLAQTLRHKSSKARLHLSGSRDTSRAPRRSPSADSLALSYREMSIVSHDSFDSWDTSSVESASFSERGTMGGLNIHTSLMPVNRVLETIPASPLVGSPAQGCPLDLEPPKPIAAASRSRSYSPAARTSRRSPSPPPAPSELNIHPLFRTDSPTPPPAATPGTIIVASPDAGRTISGKSLSRMRSGSLPMMPGGRLSRQASYDSFRSNRKAIAGSGFKTPSPLSTPSSGTVSPPSIDDGERVLTPPVPDFILNASYRPSLTEYADRKLREHQAATVEWL